MAESLKEIAAECGVSEQAIRGWCRRNHVAKDAKGSFAISEDIKTLIYQHYSVIDRNHVAKDAKENSETFAGTEMALISMLQQELESKNQQLAVKDKQIEELNARLAECSSALVVAQQTAQAAQALHAGTIQQQLTAGDADPDVSVQSCEAQPEKRGWFGRLFGR